MNPGSAFFRLIEETPNLDWLLLTKRPQEYRKSLPKAWLKDPRSNVWLMTTVEHQDYAWRIDEILKVPAVVHGLSLEPLLTRRLYRSVLEFGKPGLGHSWWRKWQETRPSDPTWFRSLRDQCGSAGVPFHFKQWGEYGSDLVKIGKKNAGRILDGRERDELPLET